MPIFMSARMYVTAYGFQHSMFWLEPWEDGKQAVHTVHTAYFPVGLTRNFILRMHGHANIKSLCTYSRVKQSMLAPEWDRQVVPKHRLLTTNLICVISQKSEYLISTGAGLGITQFVSSSRVSEKLWDPSLGPISCCEFLEVLHGNNSAEKRGADNSPVSNSEISITGALR